MKYVHLNDDFNMRVSGNLVCRTVRAWQVGLLDCANDPDVGRLDLIEGPGDQYGARFAATRGGICGRAPTAGTADVPVTRPVAQRERSVRYLCTAQTWSRRCCSGLRWSGAGCCQRS